MSTDAIHFTHEYVIDHTGPHLGWTLSFALVYRIHDGYWEYMLDFPFGTSYWVNDVLYTEIRKSVELLVCERWKVL